MDIPVRVYVEIEKDSNQKYEYNHNTKSLELDRVLKDPFVYPYNYGFIVGTKAKDNDELDALILTNNNISKDTFVDVFIIGVLVMEDEKGMDEKVLCVLEEDYKKLNNLSDIHDEIKEKIYYFFSNYKNNIEGKWSIVYNFEDKNFAIKLYNECLIKL